MQGWGVDEALLRDLAEFRLDEGPDGRETGHSVFIPQAQTEQLAQSVPWKCAAANITSKHSLHQNPLIHAKKDTHRDMTSDGKVRGISPALSHSALSLVHVHAEGQRGCLAFLQSTGRKTDTASTRSTSRCSPAGLLRVFTILATCASSSAAHEPESPLRLPGGHRGLSAPCAAVNHTYSLHRGGTAGNTEEITACCRGSNPQRR